MNARAEQPRRTELPTRDSETPAISDAYKQAMRQFAGTVTIITTHHDGRSGGMTATAVCSVSADPPRLLVCVNRSASSHRLIRAGRVIAVNILSTEHVALAREFAGNVAADERFRSGAWEMMKTGAPTLADAATVLDCIVLNEVEVGTHSVFICQVVDLKTSEGRRPLLYAQGDFAGLSPLG